jgi:putative membrane protein
MIKLQNFLKGFLMGVCDIIPGISGGTIAFITGIYQRLISSVKSFSFTLLYGIVLFIFSKKQSNVDKLKNDIKNLDLVFLMTVLFGIMTAILLTSRIISHLLNNYYIFTMSFFIGLIFASSMVIYSNIKDHKLSNILMGFLGLLTIVVIMFFKPVEIMSPSLLYIYLGGFFGISAMFLPGISGAFILLIMGLYSHVLNYLHNIYDNFLELSVFGLGIITGALVISRVIHFLFKQYKCKTLYFLFGLVIGSLFIPLKEIFIKINKDVLDISLSLTFFLIGLLIVTILEVWDHKKKKEMLIGLDSSKKC